MEIKEPIQERDPNSLGQDKPISGQHTEHPKLRENLRSQRVQTPLPPLAQKHPHELELDVRTHPVSQRRAV